MDSSYEENLAAKEALLKEMDAFDNQTVQDLAGALRDLQTRWNAIGFFPIKEKDRVQAAYKASWINILGTSVRRVRTEEVPTEITAENRMIPETVATSSFSVSVSWNRILPYGK